MLGAVMLAIFLFQWSLCIAFFLVASIVIESDAIFFYISDCADDISLLITVAALLHHIICVMHFLINILANDIISSNNRANLLIV